LEKIILLLLKEEEEYTGKDGLGIILMNIALRV